MTEPLSVSQLTSKIKTILEKGFPRLCVQGEICNFKAHSGGHLYFDLKDEGAKIPAVLFRGNRKGLSRLPKDGDQVILSGGLAIYAPHGRYQLIVTSCEFAGQGALLLRYEALKRELQAKGWFDKSHKQALPPFPKRIGVITSPTGSVIRDILNVLERRFSGFSLLLNPVRVQGETSAREIVQAIQQMNQHKLVDLLIVGRGGGSLEDLMSFNEESVAKAVFESKIPIISAVGHETDFTLCDFVADMRAPTPSAAAELAISEKTHHLQELRRVGTQLSASLRSRLRHTRETLTTFARQPLFASATALLANSWQRIDETSDQLERQIRHLLSLKRLQLRSLAETLKAKNPSSEVLRLRQKLAHLTLSIEQAERNGRKKREQKLEAIAAHLAALNPKNVLQRGYSILFLQKNDSVIVDPNMLSSGVEVRALLKEGEREFTIL